MCYPDAMLGLTVPSDASWVRAALRDLDGLLVDHAHCEMKAASNALSLVARYPGDLALVRALTELAREEVEHFAEVLAVLSRRGLRLGPPPIDRYAAELRRAASATAAPARIEGTAHLVDRLLVAALIEARSCERFKLLAEALEGPLHAELKAFYASLLAAEARHYRTLVDLSIAAAGGAAEVVVARLAVLARVEGEIVTRLALEQATATIHG